MKTRSVGLAMALLVGMLATSCGGGGNPLVFTGLLPVFAPNTPPSDPPRISLEAGGPVGGNMFTVVVRANGIDEIAGVGFTLLYEPSLADWVGCEAEGSIFLSNPSLMNSCNGSMVGGAIFAAALQGDTPGFLNVSASIQGLGAGVTPGDGTLVTLIFQATETTISPTPYDFETGTRTAETCDVLSCTQVENTIGWDGGSLTVLSP